MEFQSAWHVFEGIAIGVAVISSSCYCAALHVLERWGRSTKGVVTRSVEKRDKAGALYVVSYEFTGTSASCRPLVQTGKQTTRHGFRSKDIVAVRYWPRWPRLNQIVDRAV